MLLREAGCIRFIVGVGDILSIRSSLNTQLPNELTDSNNKLTAKI